MKIRLAIPDIQTDSIVDGEGIRSGIRTQGCLHNCPGCHNPETHSFKEGFLVDVVDLKEQINSKFAERLENRIITHDINNYGDDAIYGKMNYLGMTNAIDENGLKLIPNKANINLYFKEIIL